MMKRIKLNWRFSSLALVVALFLAGCFPSGSQPSNQGALETIVANTLTAVASESQTNAGTSTPSPAETNTPGVTQTTPRALQVAYIKGGNVYLWTEGGSTVGLTNTNDAVYVRISDDGQIIAFVRQDPNNPMIQELWAVNTTGPTNVRVLVSKQELSALKTTSPFSNAVGLGLDLIEWQPGTHTIAYSTAPYFEGPGYAPSEDLRLVNADTLAKTTIFDFDQGGIFYFSPDGTQIALSYPDHISLANADGSHLRPNVLTFPKVGTYSEYQYRPRPIWAADSQSLRVAIPPADTLTIPVPPTGLWAIPVDGSPATQLGSIPAIPFAWPDNAFSPTLDHVGYAKAVGVPEQNQREIHIANSDGSGDTIFASGNTLQFEQWTPDSTRFVYSVNGGPDRGIYLGKVSGGVFTISTAPETIKQMRWVDNSRFLFFYQHGGGWELHISDVDGTRHAFIDTVPDSSPSYDFTQ